MKYFPKLSRDCDRTLNGLILRQVFGEFSSLTREIGHVIWQRKWK